MSRKAIAGLYDYMPIRNDIFDALPHQILALRKCTGWSRADLGGVLCMYINGPKRDCYGIYRWERGLCRPHKATRTKLVCLAEMFREEYLAALQSLQPEAVRR